MKACVGKQDLMECIDFFSKLKPRSAKLVASSEVMLTVSETFRATGFGAQHDIPCEPMQWGTCVVPFKTWASLAAIVCRPMLGNTVTIEAGDGYVSLDLIRIKHPAIRMTPMSTLAFELPIDADRSQIRSFILESHTMDQIRDSGLRGAHQAIMKEIAASVRKANKHLSPYGVGLDGLTRLLAQAMKVKDQDAFQRDVMNELHKKKS